MPFNLNDSIDPDAAPSNIIGQINALASQIKNLTGESSWKTPPSKSIKIIFNPPAVDIPQAPTLGQYWDEVDSSQKLIQQWYWNGTAWISKNQMLMNIISDFSGTPQHFIPSLNGGVLIEKFYVSVPSNYAGSNDQNNYSKFRLSKRDFIDNVKFAFIETQSLAHGYNKTFSTNVNHILTPYEAKSCLNIDRESIGSPKESTQGYTAGILFRFVR